MRAKLIGPMLARLMATDRALAKLPRPASTAQRAAPWEIHIGTGRGRAVAIQATPKLLRLRRLVGSDDHSGGLSGGVREQVRRT
jgi:hypothetical protein